MKVRYVQRCRCKRTRPVVKVVEMSYGYQVEVVAKCKKCGMVYKELKGKGEMVTDLRDETWEEVTKKRKKVEKEPTEPAFKKEEGLKEKLFGSNRDK